MQAMSWKCGIKPTDGETAKLDPIDNHSSIIVTQQNTKALKNNTNTEEGRSTSNNPRPIPRKAPRRLRKLKELAKADIGNCQNSKIK